MGDLSLIIIITRMKVLLLLSFVAFTSIHLVQGGCKAKVSNAVINQKLKPFTVVDKKGKPVATAPCWWDLTRENCGKCKKGGRQCGFPMHKWCQSPRVKTGCPGIPDNKYTLSTEGAPCYWDPTNLKCAICTKKTMKQCINTLPAQVNIVLRETVPVLTVLWLPMLRTMWRSASTLRANTSSTLRNQSCNSSLCYLCTYKL